MKLSIVLCSIHDTIYKDIIPWRLFLLILLIINALECES